MNSSFYALHSPLPSEYISGGEVTKRLVYRSCDTEVAILEVAPGATITVHEHTEDSEIYFMIEDGTGEVCQLGSSHYFENFLSYPVLLLSIKTKNKLDVVNKDGLQFVQGT